MIVGENIRKIRKERGLTQRKLGELSSINEVQIRQYELGKANPKIETLQKIAKALDCTIYELTIDSALKREVDLKVTATEGILAILSEIYGNVEEKDVQEEYGESFYYSVGTGDNKFILYENDIERILEYLKASIPFMVDNMKDVRPEDEVIEEIRQDLNNPEYIAKIKSYNDKAPTD